MKGIAEVAVESTDSAKRILALREKYNEILSGYNNSNYINLLEQLFMTPSVTKNKVKDILDISYPTASTIVDEFCRLGILHDDSVEKSRNKKYTFAEYLAILNEGTEL